jgi:hypothetical protein
MGRLTGSVEGYARAQMSVGQGLQNTAVDLTSDLASSCWLLPVGRGSRNGDRKGGDSGHVGMMQYRVQYMLNRLDRPLQQHVATFLKSRHRHVASVRRARDMAWNDIVLAAVWWFARSIINQVVYIADRLEPEQSSPCPVSS